MYKVVLLNLPFTQTSHPSIALTQLKSVLEEKLGKRVSTNIEYITHDFVHYLGSGLHSSITQRHGYSPSGIAEWFFRQAAFPAAPDNTEEYLQRFFPGIQKQTRWLHALLTKRQGLEAFLDEMIDKYHLNQAHLAGFTSMFSQNLACFSMARKLKERNADLVTVMGGANCETPMGEEIVKNVAAIDFVFSGPALISFPQFVEYRLNEDFESCHRIGGVFSKANCLPQDTDQETDSHKGSTVRRLNVHTSSPQVGPGTIGKERDIDEVVELDYRSFLDSIKTHFPNKEVAPILFFETSRGCWWGERAHCTFCGLNGLSMNYRAMNPQKAIAYFNSLFAYADESSDFYCVDNILPRNYPKEVLPYLDTPANLTLFYEVKADLSEQDMQVLSQARVNLIQPGIEALATATLKLMKKGTTAFQNLRLLKYCAMYEVFPVWNLLMGFPGEKEEVYQKYLHDLPRLSHLPPPFRPILVRFDRYSPYFMRAIEYGLDLEPFDFYAYIYPWSSESLRNLAYYFVDQNRQAEYSATLSQWLVKMGEQIEAWNRAWWPNGELHLAWGKWYQQNHPQLLLQQQGHETLIHDSRSGKVVRYPISETTRQLLQYLDQPHKKADLVTKFAHLTPLAIEQEITFLQERGLLFEEDERFMSLVLPAEARRDSGLPLSASAMHKKSDLPIMAHS